MKNSLGRLALLVGALFITSSARADIITDSTGDIDPGLANAGGTLDLVSLEVVNTASDLILTLTVNGDISATDWGKFMIGIATGDTLGTITGNGWGRPINLNAPVGGMNYWIGSWVDGGSGSQLWSYNVGTSTWDGPTALGAGFSMAAGANSILTHTVSLASLGVSAGDTIYFDAYASGGGVGDSAVDALSNTNISVTAWDQVYTSSEAPGNGLSSYTIVPEPSTIALLGLGVLAVCRGLKRKAA